jgi:inositol-phosphate phosphatase / L-galactose 1-phosphate phosphatase / histidinol-phosphatase
MTTNSAILTPELIALAHRLADASGAVIRPYFRTENGVVDKADGTPVTKADREGELAIRAILDVERPGDGIWGEEFGANDLDADYVWTLDPVDGTKAFMTGKPMWGTLIGLLHRGVPILGIIDQPWLKERWIGGLGLPTTFNGQRVQVQSVDRLADAVFSTTALDMFTGDKVVPFDRFCRSVKLISWGGDCYHYGLVASGFLDGVIEAELKLHDVVALAPILQQAGGYLTNWDGSLIRMGPDPTIRYKVVASGSAKLHAEALAVLNA